MTLGCHVFCYCLSVEMYHLPFTFSGPAIEEEPCFWDGTTEPGVAVCRHLHT